MNMATSEMLLDGNPFDICVMLTTRGRTTAFTSCLTSLFNRAADKSKIQLIIALDRDDNIAITHFNEHIKDWLEKENINYCLLITERYGYKKLNRYYNLMGRMAQADWLFFWTDDAIMETDKWDMEIKKYKGQFKVLSVHANNDHPYTIFPIVPQAWVKVLGRFSRHQLNDTEISQMSYLLGIFERIPVWVTHDRADLTGNNEDDTYNDREYLEGNFDDPNDFHHMGFVKKRVDDMNLLAQYMNHIGADLSWWKGVCSNSLPNIWAKLEENDINKQVKTNIPRPQGK